MKLCQLLLVVVVATVSTLFPGIARAVEAANAADHIDWACWYHQGDQTIRCRLAGAPEVARVGAVESFDSRLPELVRTIRGNPEELAGAQISIPLWSDPTDMEYVGLLAESVMCGTQRACSVSFDANRDGGAALRVAALLASSPEELMAAVDAVQAFASSPLALSRLTQQRSDDKPLSRRQAARRSAGV